MAAGLPCSSAALRTCELLATRVAQHPMAATARIGIDVLVLGIMRDTPEEKSQEFAIVPFPAPLLLFFSAAKRCSGRRKIPSLSNQEDARGADAYLSALGRLTKKRDTPWFQIHSDIIEADDLEFELICIRLESPGTLVTLSLRALWTPSSTSHDDISECASRALVRFGGATHAVD